MNLLAALIQVSEKAANIARVCRKDPHLFALLVQEKKEEEKNPKFVNDFKTLADVLIQETIKHDIGKEFPELAKNIRGEESNTFQNTLGESITVEVLSDESSTADLLCKVLNNDTVAASLLAAEVHKKITLEDVCLAGTDVPSNIEIPVSHLGIWIDPIDSTAEYISGKEVLSSVNGLYSGGLQCVTVLIGAFNYYDQIPVLGVVNQPFYTNVGEGWSGRCVWGVSYNGENICSIPATVSSKLKKIILLSSSESMELTNKLQNIASVTEAAGAGYKMLSVALGHADAYVLSKSTTFQWDTCAPHALLLSLGGGIVCFSETDQQLNYGDNRITSNVGGFIAYKDKSFLTEILNVLRLSSE